MTDRYDCLTVALECDIRSDDAQSLIEAIRQLRGVIAVEPHIVDPASWTVEVRVRYELWQKIWKIFYPTAQS